MPVNTETSGCGGIPRIALNKLILYSHGKASQTVIALTGHRPACPILFCNTEQGLEVWDTRCPHIVVTCSPALMIPVFEGGFSRRNAVTPWSTAALPRSCGERQPWGHFQQVPGRLALLKLLVMEMCSNCGQRSVGMKRRDRSPSPCCSPLESLPGQFAKHQPVTQMRENNILSFLFPVCFIS